MVLEVNMVVTFGGGVMTKGGFLAVKVFQLGVFI